jgi:cyclopropane fatty-acyl-phospholipid synthase-like methyltransferase
MKEIAYNPTWQKNRVDLMVDLYGATYFKGKRILELGAFNGWIGNYFAETFDSEVTCVEGRQSLVNQIRNDYPLLKDVRCHNLDTSDWSFGKYDIIINFGLYYHLEKFHKEHLINCIDNCNLMFFETVVYDSNESELHFRNEQGIDQSLSDRGGTPSTSYVENILTEKRCRFVKHTSSKLNGGPHHYDWVDKNSKVFDGYARRFWVIDKP